MLKWRKLLKNNFEVSVQKYFPFDDEKRNDLKREIESVNRIIGKLDKEYARALHKSLDSYARHVRKAAHSVFEDFIFPVPIPGLTDNQDKLGF